MIRNEDDTEQEIRDRRHRARDPLRQPVFDDRPIDVGAFIAAVSGGDIAAARLPKGALSSKKCLLPVRRPASYGSVSTRTKGTTSWPSP
jgi:hypothetical protein